ncbi:MAG: hypothetical protein E7613_07630 [Ruminococcaceae bacterium]|nr:hypothetical protein [Oscillospiraceae bacterium]
MLEQIIKERGIPALPNIDNTDEKREYMKRILAEEEYGLPVPKPEEVTYEVKELENANYMTGNATLEEVTVKGKLLGRDFSFPFKFVHPTDKKNQKVIVQINFRYDCPDKYTPAEEIIDRGYSLAVFYYNDITTDNNDFTNGIAGILFPDGERREGNATGKIMMWAWAASRVADYLETLDFVDMDKLGVAGHSRLGKTALVTAAYDDRFKFAHSNDSGCSGGAIHRNKRGETVEAITRNFPFWFCPNYKKYINNEGAMEFDQHWLVAASAPRFVEIGTAVEDVWADHESEYLTCVMASEEFEKQGVVGFVHPDRYPELHEHMKDGHISYYVRPGRHFFSRYDWNKFMDFIDLKIGDNK